MRQLIHSNMDVVVESGFIYVPLLLDPEIDRELQASLVPEIPPEISEFRNPQTVIQTQGRYFIKTLSLHSLVANYAKINPYSYQQLRRAFMRDYYLTGELGDISIDGTLRTILVKVMPYFIKTSRGLERRRLNEAEILDVIGDKINVPPRYYEAAETFVDTKPLRRMMKALQREEFIIDLPEDGWLPPGELRKWCHRALHAKIVQKEYERLKQTLHVREQFSRTKKKHIAVLLYIAEKGSLEIDGCGFSRIDSRDEYLIYKRTGEYILKDYYARSYLFSDCRVAVTTAGSLRPMVIETYKHPFLRGYDSGQEICLRHFTPPKEFTADNVIKTLEEGVTTLLYGYDSRRRNGYHSLDRTRLRARPIEFVEYRI